MLQNLTEMRKDQPLNRTIAQDIAELSHIQLHLGFNFERQTVVSLI